MRRRPPDGRTAALTFMVAVGIGAASERSPGVLVLGLVKPRRSGEHVAHASQAQTAGARG